MRGEEAPFLWWIKSWLAASHNRARRQNGTFDRVSMLFREDVDGFMCRSLRSVA